VTLPASFRHLTGLPAVATVGAGTVLGGSGAALLWGAARGAQGWIFLLLAACACLLSCLVVTTLPWRLTTRLDASGLVFGWALGHRRIPWSQVRRAVVATLGSGGERDPSTVTLLLADGSEVLFAVLGRRRPEDDPATQALRACCLERGIPWAEAAAPLDERRERERKWRLARLKGWR
jgi:hypothetical protein